MGEESYKVYFAGELFSLKHLAGNALLAEAINRRSEGSFVCVLPAGLEVGGAPAVGIRNLDLLTLINSDLAIFNFDGTEIDSGTVVEYMIAKFIDMPAVIVRSDFRQAGDHDSDPWNLMLSSYPRTKVLPFNALDLYQKNLSASGKNSSMESIVRHSIEAATDVANQMGGVIVWALREVLAQPSSLPSAYQEHLFSWLRLLPGSDFEHLISNNEIKELIEAKRLKGLLA